MAWIPVLKFNSPVASYPGHVGYVLIFFFCRVPLKEVAEQVVRVVGRKSQRRSAGGRNCSKNYRQLMKLLNAKNQRNVMDIPNLVFLEVQYIVLFFFLPLPVLFNIASFKSDFGIHGNFLCDVLQVCVSCSSMLPDTWTIHTPCVIVMSYILTSLHSNACVFSQCVFVFNHGCWCDDVHTTWAAPYICLRTERGVATRDGSIDSTSHYLWS